MHWARLNVRIRSKQATTLQLRRPMRRILSTCCARAATDQVTAPPRNVINSRRLIAAPDGTLKGHAAYQPAPVVWKGFRTPASSDNSGSRAVSISKPLLGHNLTSDTPRYPENSGQTVEKKI